MTRADIKSAMSDLGSAFIAGDIDTSTYINALIKLYSILCKMGGY